MYRSREREAPRERGRDGGRVRLRLLGVLSAIASPATDGFSPVGAKPLALLAYCHLASPAGAINRDSLVGLFWPALDQARSRRALRQAVHALRTAFGRDVIHSLGKHLLVLPGGAVSSDVRVFRWLGEEGRHEAALAFYGGDFMAGANLLHVSPWRCGPGPGTQPQWSGVPVGRSS
jgi:DNA-binding SARP family transcriptional activator